MGAGKSTSWYRPSLPTTCLGEGAIPTPAAAQPARGAGACPGDREGSEASDRRLPGEEARLAAPELRDSWGWGEGESDTARDQNQKNEMEGVRPQKTQRTRQEPENDRDRNCQGQKEQGKPAETKIQPGGGKAKGLDCDSRRQSGEKGGDKQHQALFCKHPLPPHTAHEAPAHGAPSLPADRWRGSETPRWLPNVLPPTTALGAHTWTPPVKPPSLRRERRAGLLPVGGTLA